MLLESAESPVTMGALSSPAVTFNNESLKILGGPGGQVYDRRVPTVVDHDEALGGNPHGNGTPAYSGADDQQSGQAQRLRLSDCVTYDAPFAELVTDMAARARVPSRALAVRTLLHLPRVATFGGLVTRVQVERELGHSARWLHSDITTARGLVSARTCGLHDLVFAEIAPSDATAIFSSLHYLRSVRSGSVNYALLNSGDGLPVSLCSVSPAQWRKVGGQIETDFGVRRDRIWDVTRVYSCDVAPPNAISYLLARVRNAMREAHDDVDLLITAVDPNLGFAGSSYRAANWQHWLTVRARPYLYHQRRYASPRQLRELFGTSSLAELRARYRGERFEQSRVRLRDSFIFCCRLRGETEPGSERSRRPLHR